MLQSKLVANHPHNIPAMNGVSIEIEVAIETVKSCPGKTAANKLSSS